MAWLVEFDLGSGFVDKTYLIQTETLTRRVELHKDLRGTTNQCNFTTGPDTTFVNTMMAGGADVPFRVTKDGTAWFTGYIQRIQETTLQGNLQPMTLKAYDPSILLKRKVRADYKKWGSTVSVIVTELLTAAGVTSISIGTISKSIDACQVVAGEKTYWEVIEKLLADFGYVLYFDFSGTARTMLLFPATATSTATFTTGEGGNVWDELKVSRKGNRYGGARVTYWRHEARSNIVVFSDQTNAGALAKCNIDLTAYPNGYPNRNGSEDVFAEYAVVENQVKRDLLATNTVTQDIRGSGITVSQFVDYGLRAAVKVTGSGMITRFDIKAASAILRGAQVVKEILISGLTEEVEAYEAEYITVEADADFLVSGRKAYWANSGVSFGFQTFDDLTLGAVVTLVEGTSLGYSLIAQILGWTEDDVGGKRVWCEALVPYSASAVTTVGRGVQAPDPPNGIPVGQPAIWPASSKIYAHWSFDEQPATAVNGTDIRDSSPNLRNSVAGRVVAGTDGGSAWTNKLVRSGMGLRTGGNTSSTNRAFANLGVLTDYRDSAGQFAVGAWFEVPSDYDSTLAQQGILSHQNETAAGLTGTDTTGQGWIVTFDGATSTIAFRFGKPGIVPKRQDSGVLAAGLHHFIFDYRSDGPEAWVDGKLVYKWTSADFIGDIIGTLSGLSALTKNIRAGAFVKSTNVRQFRGYVDEVILITGPLEDAEKVALYALMPGPQLTVAQAEAALARIQAQAYSDGIVTAEESARIAQAAANLAAANAYSELQAGNFPGDQSVELFLDFNNDVKDRSGKGLDATINGTVSFVAGQSGKALSTPGTASNFVDRNLPAALNTYSGGFVITARLSIPTNGTEGLTIYASGDTTKKLRFRHNGGFLGLAWFDSGGTDRSIASTVAGSSTPREFAAVWSASANTMTFYLDGALIGSLAATSIFSGYDRLRVGRDNASNYASVTAEDLRLDSRTWTQLEVIGWTRHRAMWRPAGLVREDVVTYQPKHLGKYLDAAPTTTIIGATYTRYSASSGSTNRGVFRWDGTTWVRTEARQDIESAAFDISEITAQRDTTTGAKLYGTPSDYTSDSVVQASLAFFVDALINYLQAGKISSLNWASYGGAGTSKTIQDLQRAAIRQYTRNPSNNGDIVVEMSKRGLAAVHYPDTSVAATAMVAGRWYQILTAGDTVWTSFGAAAGEVGETFVATGAGTGTGTVKAGTAKFFVDASTMSTDTLSVAGTSQFTSAIQLAAGALFSDPGWSNLTGQTIQNPTVFANAILLTSGTSFVAPRTGMATVVLVGGGGGGSNGGVAANGGGGGGGGASGEHRILKRFLVAGMTYTYSIGAGGAANTNGADTLWGNIAGGGDVIAKGGTCAESNASGANPGAGGQLLGTRYGAAGAYGAKGNGGSGYSVISGSQESDTRLKGTGASAPTTIGSMNYSGVPGTCGQPSQPATQGGWDGSTSWGGSGGPGGSGAFAGIDASDGVSGSGSYPGATGKGGHGYGAGGGGGAGGGKSSAAAGAGGAGAQGCVFIQYLGW